MNKELMNSGVLFQKIRWACICLISAVVASVSLIVMADDYTLSKDLDLIVKLNISHKIKVRDMGQGALELVPGANNLATGSRNYCVQTNNKAQTRATISIAPALGGSDFKLSTGTAGNEVPMNVSIRDLKKTGQSVDIVANSSKEITAETTDNCGQGTTALFVSAKTDKMTQGNYQTTLKLTFAAK